MPLHAHAVAADVERAELASDIIVKNTFIHIDEATYQGTNGSTSAPPSVWQSRAPGVFSKLGLEQNIACDGGVCHTASNESKSTDAGTLYTTSVDAECGASEDEDPCPQSSHYRFASETTATVSSARSQEAPPSLLYRAETVVSTHSHSATLSPPPLTPPSLPSPPPKATGSVALASVVSDAKQSRVQLRTQAKPFVPTHASVPQKLAAGNGTFNRQILAIAAEVEAEIRRYEFIVGIKVSREHQGWCIAVQIRGDDSCQRDCIVNAGKQAVLWMARRARIACILGFQTQPFKDTPQGFIVDFGDFDNLDLACWGTYSDGKCPREGHCRWQHPTCQQRIVLKVQTTPSSQEYSQ